MSNLDGNMACFSCGAELELSPGNIGRNEECPKCRSDVRVCLNCRHYDTNSYNECGEPMAERVVDKKKSNFCDYFSLGGGGSSEGASKKELFEQLDNLFKK